MRTPPWYTKSKALLAGGDRLGAYRVLEQAGKRGSLEAAATLARHMWTHGPAKDCVAILREVERRVKDDDWATHYAVHLAYAIGAPRGARELLSFGRRAFYHLKMAATASADAQMYFSVGQHYWHGLNGVKRDESRAAKWLEAAASSGVPELVAEYERFQDRTQRSRPPGAA